MRTKQKFEVSRRQFMAAAATGAALAVIDSAVFCPSEAWALEATALKPETVQTLQLWNHPVVIGLLAAVGVSVLVNIVMLVVLVTRK